MTIQQPILIQATLARLNTCLESDPSLRTDEVIKFRLTKPNRQFILLTVFLLIKRNTFDLTRFLI